MDEAGKVRKKANQKGEKEVGEAGREEEAHGRSRGGTVVSSGGEPGRAQGDWMGGAVLTELRAWKTRYTVLQTTSLAAYQMASEVRERGEAENKM